MRRVCAASKILTTDFNTDGLKDIVLLNPTSNNVTFFSQDSTQNFSLERTIPIPYPNAVCAGDMDGNLTTDLLVGNEYGTISFLKNPVKAPVFTAASLPVAREDKPYGLTVSAREQDSLIRQETFCIIALRINQAG